MNRQLVLALFLICFSITSCLKKLDLHDDDLGPAVDPVEITKAMGQGFGPFDFNDIKVGEMSQLMYTQKIQDTMSQNIHQQKITVKEVQNSLDRLDLNFFYELQRFNGGQTALEVRDDFPIAIGKSSESQSMSSSSVKAQEGLPLDLGFLFFGYYAFGSCYNSGSSPETCHNLKIVDFNYKVPITAANQHGCADVDECYIPARKIEFDMIKHKVLDKTGQPVRIHHTFVLSSKVPFLSRVLQYCDRSLYEIDNYNQKLLADRCWTVNDYAAPATH